MATEFHRLTLENGEQVIVPADIAVHTPTETTVAPERRHLLAYIPWDDKYLAFVPAAYHDFFRFVLPHLGARTTNVHTALSVSFIPELIALSGHDVDEHITTIAVILHDCGWSQMSDDEIADSLDYSGLFAEKARRPKERHGELGAELARTLLPQHELTAHMTQETRDLICDIIYYHDQMRLWPRDERPAPYEYDVTVEADKLWSYTHQNFWHDTVRKGVDAVTYLENLRELVHKYLVRPESIKVAQRLWEDRAREVADYKQFIV